MILQPSRRACAAAHSFQRAKDRDYSPKGHIQLAGKLLEELVTFTGGWAGPWVEERQQVRSAPGLAFPPR